MRCGVLLLGLLAGAGAQTTPALRAGVARVDITPTVSMPMYGYDNRECGPSNGTHDPLYAKALVLESAGSRMAIVTLDLGSMVSERLKEEVAAKLGTPVLLLAASHTHSAPAFLPFGSAPVRDGSGAAYSVELERKIFRAVEQASKSMFPARLGVGRGSIQLGYNRLQLKSDGRARVLFRNPERIPWGPVDPDFDLLRVDDMTGRTRALLVHYAVHAVVLGKTSCKFSADYPGMMQTKVEAELPGTQVMFVQGGAGDINPLLMGRSGDEAADFAVARKMGDLLAAEVVQANKSVTGVDAGPIRSRSELLEFRNRWDKDKKLAVGVTTVLIGKNIAMATMPGEPMHLLQKAWKSQADVAHPLFYGYTYANGGTWAGYIPDLRSAARGGYGADTSTTIEVGAGERIIQQHLINLYDLQGMWRETPGKP
jgi:neutral ceramidase